MEELEAFVILNNIQQLGAIRLRQLICYFGSAKEVLKASESQLQTVPRMSSKLALSITEWEQGLYWEKDLKEVEKQEVQLVSFQDLLYPEQLKILHSAPALLYIKGKWEKSLWERCIAVIGTRNASLYGEKQAFHFGKGLAQANQTVVSGLARGIDTAAHRGALKHGRTIAVIGSGLSNLYPKENEALAEEICKEGALISEYPMMAPPDRLHFPQRNRIVSGLSRSILVIEAPLKSGAMLTANLGKKQGKEIAAIPGRVDMPSFKGNHLLLKQKAKLVENPDDLLGFKSDLFDDQKLEKKFTHLTPEEAYLYELFPEEELSIEELLVRAKLSIPELNVLLMSLMLKRAIQEFPGKVYRKIIG